MLFNRWKTYLTNSSLVFLVIQNQSNIILETERLLLREFNLTDAQFLMKLVKTPGWLEFIGDKKFQSEIDAIEFIQSVLIDHYNNHGFGSWLVELKAAKTSIGLCGLVNRDSLDHVDLGFALLPEYTKLGYGFEVGKATLEHAQNDLKLDPIVAITEALNLSSINLLNKLGMKFQQNITLPDDDHVMLFSTCLI